MSEKNIMQCACPYIAIQPDYMPLANGEAFPWHYVSHLPDFITAKGDAEAKRITSVKTFHGDNTFFVLFECKDPCIWGLKSKHNDPISDEEVVEVFLSPDPDSGYYYEFELSPANVRFAALVKNHGSPDWENIEKYLDCSRMKTSVEIEGKINEPQFSSRGWSAIIGIPFSMMGLEKPPENGDVWRGNFYRIDRPHPEKPDMFEHEFSCWSPTLTDPPAFHRPDKFGRIIFER